jgi:hypothetical protein
VTPRRDLRRLLRWYPSRWRSRYEEEFLAFLDDRYGTTGLPWKAQISIAFAGLRERSYDSGIVGTKSTAATQRKSGALVVLVAWSMMVVGGAVLQKTSEHYASSLTIHSHFFAQLAFNVAAGSGVVGSLLVLAGAVVAIPAFARLLQEEKWSSIRRTIVMPLISAAMLITMVVGLSVWAHHLTSAQRNGSNNLYSSAFLACALMVVVTTAMLTTAAIRVANRCQLTAKELRRESLIALGVSLSSIFVIAGAITWWIQMARDSSWFLGSPANGLSSSPWSANLVVAVAVMVLGTVTALWGASRVVLSYRTNRQIVR